MVAILITAGPTREYLDDVRFLSNGSSGRMGCALAAAAQAAGHQVTLVLGPVEVTPPSGVTVVSVVSALEMQAAAMAAWPTAEVAIAAAAVADWRPAERQAGKPPRREPTAILHLVQNPDIVAGLAATATATPAGQPPRRRVVVGFALESVAAGMPAALARGRDKLRRKGLDLVVVNLHDAIGDREIEVVLVASDGREQRLPRQDKTATAAAIVQAAVACWQQLQVVAADRRSHPPTHH
jgi:phosphopantothenoylcysteine decarboxylase/phosphopantothenate--cysteine ligase